MKTNFIQIWFGVDLKICEIFGRRLKSSVFMEFHLDLQSKD